MNITYFRTLLFMLIILLIKQQAVAQLNPMGALYFQNQYLGNPAMAGTGGLNVKMGIRKQWNAIPGSPFTQSLTADHGFTNKMGVGLNIYNEKLGVFKRLRSAATYAYHLPLDNNNQRISFGLSFVHISERINHQEVKGDPNDLSVASFNQRGNYLDGDFGLAYSTSKFNLQFAIPNLKGPLKMDEVRGEINRATFFSSISYKIRTGGSNDVEIESKAVYRGLNGMSNILDLGANLSYAENKLNLFGMYHSTNSATYGVQMNYESLGFSFMYSTSTSALSNYTDGNFEMGLKVNLLK